jgi:hypothetical protein
MAILRLALLPALLLLRSLRTPRPDRIVAVAADVGDDGEEEGP